MTPFRNTLEIIAARPVPGELSITWRVASAPAKEVACGCQEHLNAPGAQKIGAEEAAEIRQQMRW